MDISDTSRITAISSMRLPEDLSELLGTDRPLVIGHQVRNRHHVTTLIGLHHNKTVLEGIASRLKRKLCCGGTVKESNIMLQLNFKTRKQELEQVLVQELRDTIMV